jgi:hypothetical protein
VSAIVNWSSASSRQRVAKNIAGILNAAVAARDAKLRAAVADIVSYWGENYFIRNESVEVLLELLAKVPPGGGDYVPAEKLRTAEAKVKGTWAVLADLAQQGELAGGRAAVLMEALGLKAPNAPGGSVVVKFEIDGLSTLTARDTQGLMVQVPLGDFPVHGKLEVVVRRPDERDSVAEQPLRTPQQLAHDAMRQHAQAVEDAVHILALADLPVERLEMQPPLPDGALAVTTLQCARERMRVETVMRDGRISTTSYRPPAAMVLTGVE